MKEFNLSPVWIYTLLLILGWATYFMVIPLAICPYPTLCLGIGVILLALGSILTLFAYFQYRRFDTSYDPVEMPTMLIQTGIYRFTRNPIYLALMITFAAIGFIVNSIIFLFYTFVLYYVLHHHIIPHEETLLQECFGEQYTQYRQKTPRWF